MATLRELKRRIVGVKNTQQITKAMKMVAAARLRRAQENIINARPYSRKISEVLAHLLSLEKNFTSELLEEREVNSLAVVVLTSDRGLCGSFNMNAIRAAEDLITKQYKEVYEKGNVQLYCVGKKANDYFKNRQFNIVDSKIGVFAHLNFNVAAALTSELSNKFVNGEVDKVILIYNKFKSVVQQDLTTEQLLPLKPAAKEEITTVNLTEYIYEPDKASIINALVPRYLNAQVWKALLESYAAELGARMTAMDMATENAKEMISSLQLTYNKERQAAITKEILEIVSGANALKKS